MKPLLLLIFFLALAPSTLYAADRPNILFILTDDQAPWAVGVAGHPLAKTPHTDALFKSGAYLPNSFTVTPVCSPSRASTMTSRYGTELGITDWIKPYQLWDPENELGGTKWGLDPESIVWPRLLQEAGYDTTLIGKWHLGQPNFYHPTKFGFKSFMGHRHGGWLTVDPVMEKGKKDQGFTGLTADILADEVIAFLEKKRNKPFLCCWFTRAPHTRWLPVSEEDAAPYANLSDADTPVPHPDYPNLETERVKRMTREYFSSVRSVDRNLGRVMETLKKQGLEDNTIVIFSSDHGYNMGHNGIWHKGNGHWAVKPLPESTNPNIPNGQRPNMYDTSIQVPTAIRWPGVIKPGTVIKKTTTNLDWFPTICAMTGIPIPGNATIRGRDLSPLLKGEKITDWDNTFYGEYSTLHQSQTHMRCWRTNDYKLVRDFKNPERDEFYDLKNDPDETTNLIDTTDERLKQVIAEFDTSIRDQMKMIGDKSLQ
ncbi:MAG: sulfatase-like hydrolase/transferase [Verrucomicrobiota bacterium]